MIIHMGHDMAMVRVAVPLLLLLCLAVAVLVAVSVRSRGLTRQSQAVLRELADRAVELALSHRDLADDRELASMVLKRAVMVDDSLPADLLLLAEQHMDTSPSLAWGIADAARDARKQLP